MYWIVFYVHNNRRYIWYTQNDDNLKYLPEESDLVPLTHDKFKEFAPVIPIRNNFVDYTETPDPTNYKQYKKLLKLIGQDIDGLNEAITVDNPDHDKITDAYVTLSSRLASTYMDELAYNYAFFDNAS